MTAVQIRNAKRDITKAARSPIKGKTTYTFAVKKLPVEPRKGDRAAVQPLVVALAEGAHIKGRQAEFGYHKWGSALG